MHVTAIDRVIGGTNANRTGDTNMPDPRSRIIKPTRREAIITGGAALGTLVVGPQFSRAAECILTSRQIDGPYHIQDAEDRHDVRSGKPGVDLVLRLKIVDADGCEAISGVRTEIWSCDALGNYSGHPDVDPNVPPRLGGGRPPGGGAGRPRGGQGRPAGGGWSASRWRRSTGWWRGSAGWASWWGPRWPSRADRTATIPARLASGQRSGRGRIPDDLPRLVQPTGRSRACEGGSRWRRTAHDAALFSRTI